MCVEGGKEEGGMSKYKVAKGQEGAGGGDCRCGVRLGTGQACLLIFQFHMQRLLLRTSLIISRYNTNHILVLVY